MADSSRDEIIIKHIEFVRDDMARHASGINERLDTLNGRVRKNEATIAVLQDKLKADAKRVGGGWGAGAGTIASALLYWILELIYRAGR